MGFHRSISILWDDVLENLRKAMPCFMTGSWTENLEVNVSAHATPAAAFDFGAVLQWQRPG
jgi:hypothetical protein